jgi:PLD-like domain
VPARFEHRADGERESGAACAAGRRSKVETQIACRKLRYDLASRYTNGNMAPAQWRVNTSVSSGNSGWHTANRCPSVTNGKTFENPRMRALSRFLRRSGIDSRLFANPARPYDANHRKLLIVDGVGLITGGRNYADHYSGDSWRDIELLRTGPSVRGLLPLYEETFAIGQAAPVTPPKVPGFFQSTTPEEITSNAAFIFLLQCAGAARHTLDIENAYYINHPVLHNRLAAACARGVRVRLLTNSAESNDLDFANYRIYSGFPDLLTAGVEIYLRGGRGRTLHCKYLWPMRSGLGSAAATSITTHPAFAAKRDCMSETENWQVC